MSDPISRRTLQQALKAWHSASQLGQHELATLAIVDARRIEAGYDASPTSYGLALREVLRAAIDSLRPDGDPDLLDKRWRAYTILNERYIQGRAPDFIADTIGIARSTYDHTQNAALEALADELRQREQSSERPSAARAPFLAPPRPPHALIGRDQPLESLKSLLLTGQPRLALHGLPGVGKTALAIHLASDPAVQAHFSDGILWAGLGRDPHLLGLLGLWGMALGLRADELSRVTGIDERGRMLRAVIGTRRMLLVIDDAWQIEEANALMIAGPNCTTLLTTRQPALALSFAADPLHIRELDADSGRALLGQFIPTLIDDPTVGHLVAAVGSLPLAITLMGQYLRKAGHAGQERRLRSAIDDLQTASMRLRLEQPAIIDQQPSVETGTPLSLLRVITLSIEALEPDAQAALNALSIFPPRPNTFSEEAALAITDCDVTVLDALVDAGLLDPHPPDRYAIHATIAETARQLLAADPDAERRALSRLAAYFRRYDPAALTNADQINVLAALAAAPPAPAMINGLCAFLEARGLYHEAEAHLLAAEHTARASGDPSALVCTLSNLGRVLQRRGDYAQADTYYQEALSLAYNLESDEFISELYQGLGVVAMSRGEYNRAESYLHDGLSLARSLGDADRISAMLANLGSLVFHRGDTAAAEAHLTEGLDIARSANLHTRASVLLTNLGVIYARRGQVEPAEQCFREGLEFAQAAGNRENSVFLLTNLGSLATERGDGAAAQTHYQEALALARSIGQRARISQLLANLGMLAITDGNLSGAEAYLEEGLSLARSMEHAENTILHLINYGAYEIARAGWDAAAAYLDEALTSARVIGHRQYISASLNAWGELHLKQGALDAAETAFREALEIAQAIGVARFASAAEDGLHRITQLRGTT